MTGHRFRVEKVGRLTVYHTHELQFRQLQEMLEKEFDVRFYPWSSCNEPYSWDQVHMYRPGRWLFLPDAKYICDLTYSRKHDGEGGTVLGFRTDREHYDEARKMAEWILDHWGVNLCVVIEKGV